MDLRKSRSWKYNLRYVPLWTYQFAVANHDDCHLKFQKRNQQIKVKILFLIEIITSALPIMFIMEPEMVYFQYIVQSHCKVYLLGVHS
jgi:hypothetical protein